jgi:hypothetical protein
VGQDEGFYLPACHKLPVGHHAFQTKKYLEKLIIFGGLIKRI